jgi:hypothetical protein
MGPGPDIRGNTMQDVICGIVILLLAASAAGLILGLDHLS